MAIAALLCAALLAPLALAAKDDTILVSRQSAGDGGAGANALSREAVISGNGRFVAFVSEADNLSAVDNDATSNVYVRDLETDTITLVSRESGANGAAAGVGGSFEPAITPDGRFVAFQSSANNLTDADNDSNADVFVRDLQTNTTTYVSRASGAAGVGADGTGSAGPSISADGRFVAFHSYADNLGPDDDKNVTDVFVRDLQLNTTALVSRASTAAGAGGNGDSFQPAMTPDGRFVAFESDADNLSVDDDNSRRNVFVRDLQTAATELVSRQSAGDGGAGADGGSDAPSISADGRFVAFNSSGSNLSAVDNDGVGDIFVRDRQAQSTTLVSRQSVADGGAGATSGSQVYPGAISADGRYVTFASSADNLSAADSDAVGNIFVRDLQSETTTLVSRQSAVDGGGAADGFSDESSISGDGRFVAFRSAADNLSAADDNAVSNIFVRDVLGPPGATGPDTTGPKLEASAGKQKLGKPIKVTVSSDEAASLDATAKAKPKGRAKRAKQLPFKPASAELAAGASITLKLKPPKKTKRKLKAADKANAAVTVVGTDAAGNATTARLRVKLR